MAPTYVAGLRTRGVSGNYIAQRVTRLTERGPALLLANGVCPHFRSKKKRVQALPFLYAFCPAKSLTRGEENIPQTI